MVFKTLHLARQSLAKTFTQGYAQSVVAASQSSYASQNHPLGAFNSRFGKFGSHQNNFPSGTASTQHTAGVKLSDVHDSGLAAYYAAWQKHQPVDGKDWQQFQFTKRIEWKPLTTVAEVKPKEQDDVAVEEVAGSVPTGGELKRAYSTNAVDELKTVVEQAALDLETLAVAGATIERPASVQNSEQQVAKALAEETAPASQEPRAQTPISATNSTAGDSLVLSESTLASSISEAESYTEQLSRLAKSHNYGEIPAVFEAMLLSGVKPAVSAYHALLAAAIHLPLPKHQVVQKALDVYSDMLRRRVVPDMKVYSVLIELLTLRSLEIISQAQKLEDKRTRFGGMEEEGKFMFHSHETEHAILSEDPSIGIAIKLFDASTAIHANQTFSEKTYRLLVTACAETSRVEDMVRIYSHMESQSVTPCAELFPPMIQAFATTGDLRSAVECYDEYKSLAIANDKGENQLSRKDNDVYAAVIKSYELCGDSEGAHKFLSKLETSMPSEQLASLRDIVGLKAFIPQWLKRSAFNDAFVYASEKLGSQARNLAMAAICIRAADCDNVEIASSAFASLPETMNVTEPAIAMGAMHVRGGNIRAAEHFWEVLQTSSAGPALIEPTTMYTIALIGSGQAEKGLHRSRAMFSRIRDSEVSSGRAKMEVVEQIDEAIEVMGQFMAKRGALLPVTASMELMWSMVENGGLITSVAHYLLNGFGPESISLLNWNDLSLLMQIQSGVLLNQPEMDIGHASRFAHLLEVIMAHGGQADKPTLALIEKVLAKMTPSKLHQRWFNYRTGNVEQVFSPVTYAVYPPAPPAPTYEDSFDPYAATTDNKGSVAITDLLEKTHGRSSSHFNEALTRFKNMRRAGRHPRFFTYAKLITAAAKENRMDLAHHVLAVAKQDVPLLPQYRIVRFGWVTIFDAMVAACLTTGQRELAAKFHQELLDMGATPSANTFGLYITTLKESTKTFDEATEAVKIFLRAKSEGVEPSSFLYNALIGKLGKARRIDDCLFYFTEMRELGIRPTSVTYGTIVNALCRVSDEKFAEELFEEMESMPNYKPRPAPYHSMMQFFLTTKRDRSKVLSYYERMRAKNIEPTAHTHKLLIDTYATLEPVDMSSAETVLAQIRKAGSVPEAVHFSSLIHAKGCVQHDMAGARELFDQTLADPMVRPQACLYQAIFEAMVANHQIADTEAILADMKSRGVEMTPYIANSLIHGWALVKDITRAKQIYDEVNVDKREPSTYEAMTRAYMAVEDRQSAMTVVNEGLSRGYPAAVGGKILELVGGGRHIVPGDVVVTP